MSAPLLAGLSDLYATHVPWQELVDSHGQGALSLGLGAGQLGLGLWVGAKVNLLVLSNRVW